MTISEVLDAVKACELKQLGVVLNLNSTDVAIQEQAMKDILTYIDLGLVELYKRFNLRTEETVITMVEGQTFYTLDEAQPYIGSMPGRFNHVLGCFDEVGNNYTLNDENDALTILNPIWNQLQVPNPVGGEALYVIYNSAQDRINWNTDYATTIAQTIPLPPYMLEALLLYIGYRGNSSLDATLQTDNNTYYMRFEASCANVEKFGVTTHSDDNERDRLHEKGFV